MSQKACLLAALFILGLGKTANSTSYARPKRAEIFSANRLFVLDMDPESKVHRIYRKSDRSKTLWQFKRHVWQEVFYLGNNGRVVVVVGWRFKRVDQLDDDAIQFWTKNGKEGSYSVRQLVGHPSRTRGVAPIGGFWRCWYKEVSLAEDRVSIETTGFWGYTFSMGSFRIDDRWIAVSGLLANLLGYVLLLLAACSIFRTWKSTRGPVEKRLRAGRWLATAGPVSSLLASFLYLSHVPLIPSTILYVIYCVVALAWLIFVPVSTMFLFKTRKKPGGKASLGAFVVQLLILPVLYLAYMIPW